MIENVEVGEDAVAVTFDLANINQSPDTTSNVTFFIRENGQVIRQVLKNFRLSDGTETDSVVTTFSYEDADSIIPRYSEIAAKNTEQGGTICLSLEFKDLDFGVDFPKRIFRLTEYGFPEPKLERNGLGGVSLMIGAGVLLVVVSLVVKKNFMKRK